MDVAKCEVFLRAVDTGSLSKTAGELGYTPSGVSRIMAALEDEVGFPLLIRSRTGVRPTADGESLLPFMRGLLRSSEQCEQACAEVRGVITGKLTIGTYSSMASHWLPHIIKAFHADCPEVRIHTIEGVEEEIEAMLADNRADFCFYSRQTGMKCDWIPLKDDPMLAVLPPDHPKARLDKFPIADCAGEPFIMPAMGYDNDAMEILEAAGISPEIRYSTMESYATFAMIECGLGITVTNALITKGWSGNVAMLPIDPPRHITLGIAVPSIASASPAARRFIQYAREIVPKL